MESEVGNGKTLNVGKPPRLSDKAAIGNSGQRADDGSHIWASEDSLSTGQSLDVRFKGILVLEEVPCCPK